MKRKFWNWVRNEGERTLFLNGEISDETWYEDEVTPKLFKDELLSGEGDITAWINSKIKERIEKENEECKVVDISILAASPFACNAIVEKAFCLAYKEQEESY